MDKVFIKNLCINCIVGILEQERIHKQRLLVNIEIDVDLEPCAKTQDLNQSVDYAKVCELVSNYIKNKKALLLESLAYELCDLIFANFRVAQGIKLSLEKPDILENCQGVGICVQKQRK